MFLMRNITLIFLIFLLNSCANRHLTEKKIYIIDNDKYGDIDNGFPVKDTLIDLKNEEGKIVGKGRLAIHDNETSNLKVGNWKEYDQSGILISEGNYKIGSFIDCCTGGACKSFYYYREGLWKYYSKNGDLKYELIYTPTKLKVDTRCQGGDKLLFGLIKEIPLKYSDELVSFP